MKQSVITVAIIVLLALNASDGRGVSTGGAQAIWAVSDGEKIEQDELNSPYKRGNAVWDGKKIKLFGARNEVIAFQMIVESGATGIKQFTAALRELKKKGGQG